MMTIYSNPKFEIGDVVKVRGCKSLILAEGTVCVVNGRSPSLDGVHGLPAYGVIPPHGIEELVWENEIVMESVTRDPLGL